jgi:hypothetical protein
MGRCARSTTVRRQSRIRTVPETSRCHLVRCAHLRQTVTIPTVRMWLAPWSRGQLPSKHHTAFQPPFRVASSSDPEASVVCCVRAPGTWRLLVGQSRWREGQLHPHCASPGHASYPHFHLHLVSIRVSRGISWHSGDETNLGGSRPTANSHIRGTPWPKIIPEECRGMNDAEVTKRGTGARMKRGLVKARAYGHVAEHQTRSSRCCCILVYE